VLRTRGEPPGRCFQRPKSSHHLCQRCQWWAPLGGAVGDPGVPTTYVRDADGGPPRGTFRDQGVPTTYVGDINGAPLEGAVGDLGAPTTYVKE
jgi:hypothetical protein